MGREQIRSPARTWNDRHQGVDCDCYSVFISTILYNLGIPHVLRITKYSEDHFQHIYPIVPLDRGYITIDCVTYSFDYEVPYSDKHDTKMDLEFLNGIDNTELALNADARDLMGAYDDRAALQELGKLFKKKSAGGNTR